MRLSAPLTLLGLFVAASAVCLGASGARAEDTRVTTLLDDVTNAKNRECWSLVTMEDSDAKRFRCPGLGDWRVEMVSSGRRTYVVLGQPAAGATPAAQLIPAPAIEPGQSIAWQLRNGRPMAAWHLYLLDGRNGPSEAAVVYKLDADRTACIAAVVAEEYGRDLAVEAQRLATNLVPTFKCGRDRPVTVGRQLAALR